MSLENHFNLINYDNVGANHLSLLDKLGKSSAQWLECRAGPTLVWALFDCLYAEWAWEAFKWMIQTCQKLRSGEG